MSFFAQNLLFQPPKGKSPENGLSGDGLKRSYNQTKQAVFSYRTLEYFLLLKYPVILAALL